MIRPRMSWGKLNQKKGQAFLLSYLIIAVFITLSASLLTKAISDKNITERQIAKTQTLYLAEGSTEDAILKFTTALANFQNPSDPFFVNTTFSSFPEVTVSSTITSAETGERATVDSLGRNIYVRDYEVVSTAQIGSVKTTVHQIIARKRIPTFQHMIFYNDDLEILPGGDMTVGGRVHGNHNIYLGARDNKTLTMETNYLRSAGSIYNYRKDNPGDIMYGDVSILVSGDTQYQDMDGLDSTDPNWTTLSLSRWNGTVQDSAHGVTQLTAPSVGTTTEDGFYATNANILIKDNKIYKNGVEVNSSTYPAGTITTTTTSFYNQREEKFISMMTIDMAKLAGISGTCASGTCQNYLPSNGLLYATNNQYTAANEPGIKLTNGSKIAAPSGSGGLTVVSNQPVYVRGDYNTTTEVPTAIIADSLNLLSNAWTDDTKSWTKPNASDRDASTTTYNCAFVAGSDPTSAGNYCGGLENYPRLHEDWGGKTLNIKGSFVELWNSGVATGPWEYGGDQYYAPGNRNWNYNTAFNDPNNLPPFTPCAIEAQRLAWWTD